MRYGYIRVSSDKQTVVNQRFEIERNLISQRTKEALARLKAEGKPVGRPPGRKTRKELHSVYRHEAYVRKALQNGLSQREIAERIHCSRNTLRRYIAQYLNL